jgi:nucleoside-diphosphate kinase
MLVGRIMSRIEDTFMRLLAVQERHKTLEWAEQHYAHLADEPFFGDLCKFMCVRPIISLNVVGWDSINRMRRLAGSTDSTQAAPGTIRGDWGHYPIMYNLIHVSDSEKRADIERDLFYDLNTTVFNKAAPQEGE